MKLTALLACKNREDNLKYCLASIKQCSPRPFVILVDFGSNIPLFSYTKQYPKMLNVIRVERDTKLFHKARALNIGLKRIKTPYFCATDVDELFNPNFFGKVLNALCKGPKQMVLCKTYFLKTPVACSAENFNATVYQSLLHKAKSNKKLSGEGCCIGLSTLWAKTVGGWDEQYKGYGGEDSDLILRAKFAGFNVNRIHTMTDMVHMQHPKIGEYYAQHNYFLKNKIRYYNKRKSRIIIANTNYTWGAL